jgi:hypothetical protein
MNHHSTGIADDQYAKLINEEARLENERSQPDMSRRFDIRREQDELREDAKTVQMCLAKFGAGAYTQQRKEGNVGPMREVARNSGEMTEESETKNTIIGRR